MEITTMTEADFRVFWPVFKDVVVAQETYAFDPNIDYTTAAELWMGLPQKTYVAKEGGELLGSYYIKPNAAGPSSHICNCGYMVSPSSAGRGVATAMCLHSQQIAIELGFSAMQFNSVVATNEVAVKLWKKLGFMVIGTIPMAYKHKRLGLVDSYIMYKPLLA